MIMPTALKSPSEDKMQVVYMCKTRFYYCLPLFYMETGTEVKGMSLIGISTFELMQVAIEVALGVMDNKFLCFFVLLFLALVHVKQLKRTGFHLFLNFFTSG